MTAPTPRRSAAAARRIRHHHMQPENLGLTPDLLRVVNRFCPQGGLAEQWDEVGAPTIAVVTAARITGSESLRKHLTHVGYFLAWATREGHPPALGTVRRELTDEYTRIGMAASSAKSRADRRARLRSVADRVNPDQAPDRGVTVARPAVKPPYSPNEMLRILRVTSAQPTPIQLRKLSVCVGLGAGAGLDSPDLRHLRRRAITDDLARGIAVTVGGSRPRTVTVLRDYEPLVRAGLIGLRPDDLVLGVNEARRTIAARAISDATLLGDCPHIEQSRLRSTWLAHLLTHRVPVSEVLRAAGLTSGRTLADLLPFLPKVTDPAGLLRDPEGIA